MSACGIHASFRRRLLVMPRVRLALILIVAAFNAAFAQQVPRGSSKDEVVPVSLAKPVYPPLARQADISGEVTVSLTVHEDRATEAVVVSGHPMLKQAALDSARQSRFECRMCSAPVSYLLVYTFKQADGADCCSAFTVPPKIEEPQSNEPNGWPQTHITIVAEHVCICDPIAVLSKRVRSPKCLYLWRCSLVSHKIEP